MSTTTIWSVLNNTLEGQDIKRGIEIPMIQRDYAQGRLNDKASEIRKVFLNKLLSSIEDVIYNGKLPLELDFVYGFIENSVFIPLDGQQRLTTLYLLHWYHAFKENKLSENKSAFSKFNYQTRQSSADFFKRMNNDLTETDHNAIFINHRSFKSVITNKNWYFLGWKHDLTIQSCLTMLDEIHHVFQKSRIQLCDLIDTTTAPVVFNFLNIKNVGLSDDLYIKMNARGKPLTSFENLKAELGKFIKESDFNNTYTYSLKHSNGAKMVDVETYFVTRTDTAWSDFFWKIRNEKTNEFDDKLLNILGFVGMNELARVDIKKFESNLKELEKSENELSYYKFRTLDLLSEKTTIFYIDLLDLLVTEDELLAAYLKDSTFLDKQEIIKSSYLSSVRAVYQQRVLFYALFKFLIDKKISLQREELKKWDRLVRNLVTNTIYNEPKNLHESLAAIDIIINAYAGDIYDSFLSVPVSGFDSQQITEEKIKISLIRKSVAWQSFITESEAHPYLKGQIMVLLSFSGVYDTYLKEGLEWDEHQEATYIKRIKLYFEKFKKVFHDAGLRHFENELFRRALLATGDYLLYSTNESLLIDSHRDISWKRLLKETGNRTSKDYYIPRCNYLKTVFDSLDVKDVDASLKQIIKDCDCNDWRKDFINNSILITLSKQYYLKFIDEDSIYVLRKSKYNKYADPEVKSLLLREMLFKKGFLNTDIELGYDDTLQQYGIVRIKNYKPRVVYNHDGEKNYLFKQKGKEDFITKSKKKMVDHLVENFLL
ncbi:DUF262 domain-containing protein [Flavobacterium sp.]|uniref:GmrSD restriction endonuclease domain-containing protein n=1 Tax=Flavobacterium sp. TaxID=239 RepID=UPI00374CD0A6